MYKIEAIEKGLQLLEKTKIELENILKGHLINDPDAEKVYSVFDVVGEHFNVAKNEIKSNSRKAPLPDARKIISMQLTKRMDLSDREIADLLHCDRSTVANAKTTGEELLSIDERFKRHFNKIEMALNSARI